MKNWNFIWLMRLNSCINFIAFTTSSNQETGKQNYRKLQVILVDSWQSMQKILHGSWINVQPTYHRMLLLITSLNPLLNSFRMSAQQLLVHLNQYILPATLSELFEPVSQHSWVFCIMRWKTCDLDIAHQKVCQGTDSFPNRNVQQVSHLMNFSLLTETCCCGSSLQ